MKKKRKTPTERIQSFFHPDLESAWIKTPGKIKSVKGYRRAKKSVKFESPDYLHTQIHTHPMHYPNDFFYRAGLGIPSLNDFAQFFENKNIKTMIVAQINPKLKKVEGYTFVRKKKQFVSEKSKNLISKLEVKNGLTPHDQFGDILNSRYIQCRFVPVKGYKFNPAEFIYQRKNINREYRLGIIIFFAFLAILLFFQKRFTGFVISAGMIHSYVSVFILFMLLIGVAIFLIRRKRKNKIIRLIEDKL